MQDGSLPEDDEPRPWQAAAEPALLGYFVAAMAMLLVGTGMGDHHGRAQRPYGEGDAPAELTELQFARS